MSAPSPLRASSITTSIESAIVFCESVHTTVCLKRFEETAGRTLLGHTMNGSCDAKVTYKVKFPIPEVRKVESSFAFLGSMVINLNSSSSKYKRPLRELAK